MDRHEKIANFYNNENRNNDSQTLVNALGFQDHEEPLVLLWLAKEFIDKDFTRFPSDEDPIKMGPYFSGLNNVVRIAEEGTRGSILATFIRTAGFGGNYKLEDVIVGSWGRLTPAQRDIATHNFEKVFFKSQPEKYERLLRLVSQFEQRIARTREILRNRHATQTLK